MNGWLSLFTAPMADTTTTIHLSGKAVNVICSARAIKALERRNRPLVAEVKLEFACVAHKQVNFHDTSAHPEVIEVNDRLGIIITTIVPNGCAVGDACSATRSTTLNFTPKWVRIDYLRGEWIGEYGL